MKSGYTLDPRETVIKEINRHWVDLIPVAVSSLALIIVDIALVYFASRFADQLKFLPSGFVILLVLTLLLLAAAISTVGIYIYHQNKLIMTDMHLIQIVQNGLFGRSVSQLSIAKVQDVSASRRGFFATMLDYGSIEVETAGEDDNFVFNFAPHPQQLADECLSIHEKYAPLSSETKAEV